MSCRFLRPDVTHGPYVGHHWSERINNNAIPGNLTIYVYIIIVIFNKTETVGGEGCVCVTGWPVSFCFSVTSRWLPGRAKCALDCRLVFSMILSSYAAPVVLCKVWTRMWIIVSSEGTFETR